MRFGFGVDYERTRLAPGRVVALVKVSAGANRAAGVRHAISIEHDAEMRCDLFDYGLPRPMAAASELVLDKWNKRFEGHRGSRFS